MTLNKVLILSLILFPSLGYSQSPLTINGIINDSLLFKNCDGYLDTVEFKYFYFSRIDSILHNGKPCNSYSTSETAIYAKVFDYLLDNGLDFTYDYVKNRPRFKMPVYSNPLNESDLEKIRLNDIRMERNEILYLYFKILGDYNIYCEFHKPNISKFHRDINNIINYGCLHHPKIVQEILLGKSLSRSQYEELMERH